MFCSHSHAQLFETPWTTAHQASMSFTISWNLLNFVPIETVMPPVNRFILCHTHPHLLTSLTNIRVFSNDLALRIRWPKYCSFKSVLPVSSQCWFPLGLSGLISLQFKGLKSLLQHHNSKISIIWLSTFFMVQISHPCTTTGKNHTLTFASKGMSLVSYAL